MGVLASGDAAPGERVAPTAPGAGDQSTVDGQVRKALNAVGFQPSRSWSDKPATGETSGFGTYLWYDFVGRHWRVFVNDQRTSADSDSKVAFIRRRRKIRLQVRIGQRLPEVGERIGKVSVIDEHPSGSSTFAPRCIGRPQNFVSRSL